MVYLVVLVDMHREWKNTGKVAINSDANGHRAEDANTNATSPRSGAGDQARRQRVRFHAVTSSTREGCNLHFPSTASERAGRGAASTFWRRGARQLARRQGCSLHGESVADPRD